MNVVVVGGGPAGSAVAITLARAGVPVTLVDRARFPRDKCCGDGLTTGALRRLEGLGLDPGAVTSFSCATTSRSARRRGASSRSRCSAGRACMRRWLAASTSTPRCSMSRSLGVSILEGDGVADVEVDDRGAEVALDSGVRIGADYVVAADGAHRPCGGHCGRARAPLTRRTRGTRCVAGALAPTRRRCAARPRPSSGSCSSRLSCRAMRGRSRYRVELRTSATGSHGAPARRVTSRPRRRRRCARHPFLTSLLGTGAAFESTVRAWPIPTGVGRGDLVGGGGRVLFCGDAAASADPFTGEGIAQALETGAAAGRALAPVSVTRRRPTSRT